MLVIDKMNIDVFAEVVGTLAYAVDFQPSKSQTFFGVSPVAGPCCFTVDGASGEVTATSLYGFGSEFDVSTIAVFNDHEALATESDATAADAVAGGQWAIRRHDIAEKAEDSQRLSYSISGVTVDLDVIPAANDEAALERLRHTLKETITSMASVPASALPHSRRH